MEALAAVREFVDDNPLTRWLIYFVVFGLIYAVLNSFLRARKIQPNGFSWRTFRNEIFFAVINLTIGTAMLGFCSGFLRSQGWVEFNSAPAAWWVIAAEYAFFFLAFDTYFYWFHRAMHIRQVYPWVHKIHHFSTSPNVLTTVSLNPLETVINGLCVPLLTAAYTFHSETMAFIGPTNVLMGFYVHSGYEFLPRWWHRTWLTKWFITASFHDQHHKYFNYNFGGFTPIWDYICGTVRAKYEEDFERTTTRGRAEPVAVAAE